MTMISASPQPVPPPVASGRPAAVREPDPPRETERETASEAVHVGLDLREAGEMPVSCYVDGLLHGLAAIGAHVRLTLIGPERELPPELEVVRWIDAPGEKTPSRGGSGRGPLDPGPVDLIHAFGAGVPPIRAPRYLLTLHDVPEGSLSGWTARLVRRWTLGRSIRRNVRLVATSAQPRDALEGLLPRLGDAIWTIHSGPGDVRSCIRRQGRNGNRRAPEGSADVRTKRWFLTTAGAGKSGNMDFLISAMALWYRKRIEAPRLIWAGGEAGELDGRWSRIPARARHHIRVMPPGSDASRDQLFDEAVAFIIPELEPRHAYDALEAMNRSVPVLCARRRPFTDLLGQAPLWFDPRDSSTLWRALDALLDDPTLRPDVVSRGLREAARYDWCETAEMTLGAYRQLMRTFPGKSVGRS